MNKEYYGRIAYDAYRAFSDGKSLVSGQPIPEWLELPEKIRDAWVAAAAAVLDDFTDADKENQ